MTELDKIRFLLFVLLMIFPVHALDVLFSSADGDFKQMSEIKTRIDNGEKIYHGTTNRLTYETINGTAKVIVYIVDRSRFVEIMRNIVRRNRSQIARQLKEWHCELVILGIENFDGDEYQLISGFLVDIIQPFRENQPNLTIDTIGENHFDRVYPCNVMNIEKYQENGHICGGALQARLREIPRGALAPVAMYVKEIRLRGFHPYMKEVQWPVSIVNGTYVPKVNVMDRRYNFRIRYGARKIYLLILGGEEFTEAKDDGRFTETMQMQTLLDEMTANHEGLYILGVFNFDWTEINIVTQIILEHSVGLEYLAYNVFTFGYGMFNSFYLNDYIPDGRYILPQQKSNMTKLMENLIGAEVKQRFINMYYSTQGWKMRVDLHNGRYAAQERFFNFTFPWKNQSIAFIVYDSSEKNNAINVSAVNHSVNELKESGIHVVLIEVINFGPDDMHIIAEWIDHHRGVHMPNMDHVIDSEQIAVLGGGTFDTIFQSKLTTYRTLHFTKNNELKNIRNAFVPKGNGKRVLATDLHGEPNLEIWIYPINAVNGYYEPDLIPDKNMLGTDGRNIFFIITTANYFHECSTFENEALTTWLRRRVEHPYPTLEWRTFLVGFDNFEERDYHFFIDLVKRQTRDERFLDKYVRTFSYGGANYQFKDFEPIKIERRVRVVSYINSYFERLHFRTDDDA